MNNIVAMHYYLLKYVSMHMRKLRYREECTRMLSLLAYFVYNLSFVFTLMRCNDVHINCAYAVMEIECVCTSVDVSDGVSHTRCGACAIFPFFGDDLFSVLPSRIAHCFHSKKSQRKMHVRVYVCMCVSS